MSYQLNYFNGKGRGEVVRMVCAAGGKKYEDRRIEFKDWPEEKKKAPQGTVPYLVINGKEKVGQSIAIARYFARECSLYGKTNIEGLYIDEIVDIAVELLNKGAETAFEKDPTKKAEMQKKYDDETAPKLLNQIQEAIKLRGKNNFAVGSSLTLADIQIYVTLEVTQIKEEILSKYPQLKANQANTAKQKGIKEWLQARPKTDF